MPKKTVPVWHKDVRYFELEQNGKTIGGVYMDLYAREGKRGGAWMNDYKGCRRFADGTLQLPTAYLVCNFAPPVGGKEARLSHDEILTSSTKPTTDCTTCLPKWTNWACPASTA